MIFIAGSDLAADILIILTAAFLIHALFSHRFTKRINTVLSLLVGLAVVVSLSPLSVRVNPQTLSITLLPGFYFGQVLYYLSFSYIVVYGLISLLKNKKARDRFLAYGIIFLAVSGYSEALLHLLFYGNHSQVSLAREPWIYCSGKK